ncbi:hypothetical protein CC80DRAFT_206764 [Byssothecium circinans]|uniref:C2H2-type domain-containing protein n=1 Tax=Byssothecium circinans TaxID=147558 RepID=A0A6A5TKQ0_9PLEO|nr:hypothetical protein CC80DRAFT_206764 [Byssothecium circinans]
MDGKNSSGRRISLLNDNPSPPHPLRLPSYTSSLASRSSSYTSSPVHSPPTPQLVRSNSSDSTADMGTPSPVTPDFNFDDGLPQQNQHQHASPVFSQASFFPMQKGLPSTYPPMPQMTGPLPYPPTAAAQPAYYRSQQIPENQSASPAAPANQRSKKNSYPCPHAKQYNCNDFFTTSGHAARHAKKHTGKKDALCPECNKAFTRKDNMEQHRRTHQSGRNAAKGGDVQVKKAKQTAKQPRPKISPLQSSNNQSMSSVSSFSMTSNEPSFPLSPASSTFAMAPAVQQVDYMTGDYSQRMSYPDPTPFAMAHSYPAQSSYGLDALAIAASGEKRKYES